MDCDLHRGRRGAVQNALVALLLAGMSARSLAADRAPGGPDAARIAPAPPLLPPLEHLPLDPPLRLTGSFGELRGGHFHAGLDFSTGGRVGRPVYAALSGFIERVRTSGAGYGRSLYLRARDGRLIVMAHLDQFARPIAEYVSAFQDSTGRYEQDLWPDSARFRVRVGEVLGWTGRSGTLPPHLHFEVRRGDVAYNPLRAGISLRDTLAPVIARVTLEPLDDTSFVNRRAAPWTMDFDGRPDTVVLQGRARAIVEATDATDGVRRTLAPWSLALEAPPAVVECRLDSASWATDMSEVDYVYDRGRITSAGRFSIMLWAPREFRPVVIAAPRSGEDAGTLELAPREAARVVRIVARDVAGHSTARELVLRAPALDERGPDPAASSRARLPTKERSKAAAAAPGDPAPESTFDFVALPGRHLRVIYRGAPEGSRGVWVETARSRRQPASVADGAWNAILPEMAGKSGASGTLKVGVGGTDSNGSTWTRSSPEYVLMLLDPSDAAVSPPGAQPRWGLERGSVCERTVALLGPAPPLATGAGELTPAGPCAAILPGSLPLRRPATVQLVPDLNRPTGHIGLFHDEGDGWEFVSGDFDMQRGMIHGDSRESGRFALLQDTIPPRVTLRRAPRRAARLPYSRWALEAGLEDAGSGIDARASHFVVDGRAVPSEWDGEVSTLRWRPLRRPAPGRHRYEVVAADRAGNLTRRTAFFVID